MSLEPPAAPRRTDCEGGFLNLFEAEGTVYGFSELGVTARGLQRHFAPRRLLFLRQVHGDRIVSDAEWSPGAEADGLILTRGGVAGVVQTADCVPLFFRERAARPRATGIVHAGWRGLRQGIERRLLERLAGLGIPPARLEFFLGPAISGTCYEVGPDCAEAFAGVPGKGAILAPRAGGKFLLDLKLGLRRSLVSAGVEEGAIADCHLCTHCLPGRFPSYRRDGATGRRIFSFCELTG